MYVPKKSPNKQPGINNNDGEYEGIWSGPYAIATCLIRYSHKTRPEQKIARGYEDVPIRIQPIDNSDQYMYQVVDGNKRLKRAKRTEPYIMAYLWEGKYDASSI